MQLVKGITFRLMAYCDIYCYKPHYLSIGSYIVSLFSLYWDTEFILRAIKMLPLRGLDTEGGRIWLPVWLFCTPTPSEKGSASKFFPFRVDVFSEGTQTIWKSCPPPPKVYPVPLTVSFFKSCLLAHILTLSLSYLKVDTWATLVLSYFVLSKNTTSYFQMKNGWFNFDKNAADNLLPI